MIYDYGNTGGNLLTAAVFMCLELLLLWWFTKDFPERFRECFGSRTKFFAGWGLTWLLFTLLQCFQGTMDFEVNFLLRVAVIFVFLKWQYVTDWRFNLYIGLIFFLTEDVGKMTFLDVVFPIYGLNSSATAQISWGYIAGCIMVQGILLSVIKPRISRDFSGFFGASDMASVFFPVIPYGLIKYLQITSYTDGSGQEWRVSLVCLMLCVCDLVILVQTQHRLNAEKAKKEADALRIRSEAQLEVYEQEQRKLVQISKIYHDMKHHFNYIQSLSDNTKIREYICSVTGELNPSQIMETTGNEVIDCVLARSQSVCAELDICLIPTICGTVFDFLEPKDIMAIFGNALDNACEAVKEVKSPVRREIIIRGDKRKNFAILRVENPYIHTLCYDREGVMKTTKKDWEFHGYGLKNIQMSAKRYGGEAAVETAEGKFILTVMIPIPSDS